MRPKKVKIKGYVTGIEQIDRECLGLKDGDLYCLCYTEHVDHTSLLSKIIIGLASRDISVVVFTIDCSHGEMYKRLIDVIQNYDVSLLGKEPFQRALDANEIFASYAIWIQDTPELDYESLQDRLQCLSYLNKHAVECIVIDNLQKMGTNFQTLSKEMQIEANLYLMKMIAKEYKIPVIIFTRYDKMYMDKIMESNHIDKTMIIKTTDDDIDDTLTSIYSTITVPQHDFADNLFESVLSVVIAPLQLKKVSSVSRNIIRVKNQRPLQVNSILRPIFVHYVQIVFGHLLSDLNLQQKNTFSPNLFAYLRKKHYLCTVFYEHIIYYLYVYPMAFICFSYDIHMLYLCDLYDIVLIKS